MAVIKTYREGSVHESSVDDATFNGGVALRPAVLREAVVMYEANRRVGTVNTLSRRFVNGSGKKFQKQKHVGRARHGDRKAPQFRGGGVAHGPHPRDHSFAMPRKSLRRALRVALAGKLRDGEVLRWEGDVLSGGKPSTKSVRDSLETLGAGENALVVAPGAVDQDLVLSVRNLPRVRVLPADDVSAYDVVAHRYVVFLDNAYEMLTARLDTGRQGGHSPEAEEGSAS